jgi:Fe-S-cluster containining protein
MQAFECRMCGDCCYGEGGISLDGEEIQRISNFLLVTPEDFVSQFCEQRHGRICIKTGPDNFCIFYHKEKRCRIHPVKPGRCSLWPFYPAIVQDKENWETAKDACPGINPECSFEEFVKQAKQWNS